MLDTIILQFPNVSISLNIISEPEVFVRDDVLLTILSNIFSNVVKHAAIKQDIVAATLVLDDKTLSVSNATNQFDKQAVSNYGFGLEINQQLCDAIGWHFDTHEMDELFTVTMTFDPH